MTEGMIFESHAHYDDDAFDQDREQLIETLKENKIEYVINVGASLKSTRNTIELTKKYPFFYGAVGVHPSDTAELDEESFQWPQEQCELSKIVAVGEIGLDYYWDTPDHETQKKWFFRQMELAKSKKLPMIIHSRDAAKDTLDFMKEAKADVAGGVVHCFSYGKEMAREFLSMNFYLGIGGVVTFNNAKKLKEVVEYVPIEKILLETDSPYLAPVPNRGKRNSSLNLPFVAKEIAAIKNMAYDDVVAITNRNARQLFRMGEI